MGWGQPWKWRALEKLPIALCLLPRGAHGKVGLEEAALNFLLSHGAQEPPRGAQPQGLGAASALPHPTHLFLSYQCSVIQDKAGHLETQLQSGSGCGREGLPKGLGDGPPTPPQQLTWFRHFGGESPGRPQSLFSGGPACERLEVNSGVGPGARGPKGQLRPAGETPLEPRDPLMPPHHSWLGDFQQAMSQPEKDLEVPNDHKPNKSQREGKPPSWSLCDAFKQHYVCSAQLWEGFCPHCTDEETKAQEPNAFCGRPNGGQRSTDYSTSSCWLVGGPGVNLGLWTSQLMLLTTCSTRSLTSSCSSTTVIPCPPHRHLRLHLTGAGGSSKPLLALFPLPSLVSRTRGLVAPESPVPEQVPKASLHGHHSKSPCPCRPKESLHFPV